MKFGYARVSTYEQNLDLQLDALLREGVEEECLFVEKVSAAKSQRFKREELLEKVRKGDEIVIWKLDRFARSLIDFVKITEELRKKGVYIRSITEPMIDNRDITPSKTFFMNMMAIMAQFERDIIIERTKAGLESAKKRGQVLGRSKGLTKQKWKKAERCKKLYEEGILNVQEICDDVKVTRATFYNYLRRMGVETIREYKRRER